MCPGRAAGVYQTGDLVVQAEALDKRIAPGDYQGDMDFRGKERPLRLDHKPPDPKATHEAWRVWIDAESVRLGIDLEDQRETNLTGAT